MRACIGGVGTVRAKKVAKKVSSVGDGCLALHEFSFQVSAMHHERQPGPLAAPLARLLAQSITHAAGGVIGVQYEQESGAYVIYRKTFSAVTRNFCYGMQYTRHMPWWRLTQPAVSGVNLLAVTSQGSERWVVSHANTHLSVYLSRADANAPGVEHGVASP